MKKQIQVIKKRLLATAVLAVFLGILVSTALPVNYNEAQAACVAGDSNSDGDPCDPGEDMFNCKVDCLPAGVPTKSITDFLGDATKWLLGFAVMASIVILVWGGINYIASSGDPQKADTSKKVVKYALMGILVVGVSYAIIVALDAIFH